MNLVQNLWHPSILLFLGIVILPVLLHVRGAVLRSQNSGYRAIFWGSVMVSVAAFVDYLEELAWMQPYLEGLTGLPHLEGHILPFVYFPGIVALCAGIALWLPRVQGSVEEAKRRQLAEEELMAMVQEMRNLSVRAEDANQAKADFMAAMGHELRTPLNSVIGFAELLQNDPDGDMEKRQEYLGIILQSGRNLLNMINDILEFSNSERTWAVGKSEGIDLEGLVESCIIFKCARFDNNTPEVVHERAPGTIWTDRKVLKQIILNLLANAIKYTPLDGQVTVSYSFSHKGCRIRIEDTGIGMDAEELADAMKPFVQVDQGLARLHEGTGLGMPLADRFCRKLGGKMVVLSEKGVGTNIEIRLPHLLNENTIANAREKEQEAM